MKGERSRGRDGGSVEGRSGYLWVLGRELQGPWVCESIYPDAWVAHTEQQMRTFLKGSGLDAEIRGCEMLVACVETDPLK